METLEKSRMCRLCGKQTGIAIDIFDNNENHVRKINAILPILVHEMDLLPKQMCHRCSYKLEEFYNFYMDCAKTDTELKSQLSWMKKENLEEKIITPMVKMNRFKIKTEPLNNSDFIDSNVLEHISDNSLFFPVNVLQKNFESNSSQMVSCSQCLCNRSIKVNKKTQKEVKVSLKIESEKQAHNSNLNSIANKKNEFNKSISTNKNCTLNENIYEDNLKEKSLKEIPIVNLDIEPIIFDSANNTNFSKSKQLNRELRPRKSSVDYMGQKKKAIDLNLKAKFKSKLNMLDPGLVTPIDIKVYQNNSIHSTPIIKLEKVDDAIKNLRTHKNLEEFNRRIKEFQNKTHKNQNSGRKSLQKEIQRRKSLQKEENQNKKMLQNGENMNPKSSSRNENRKSLQKEEIQNRSSLQININRSEMIVEESKKIEENLQLNTKNHPYENTVNIADIKIKQEVINKTIEINESLEQPLQKKVFEINSFKDRKLSKHIDKLPLCAVVKLEKDYTCNVDYPRIKIKRHIAVGNCLNSESGATEVPEKQKSILKLDLNRSITNNEKNFSVKNLRSKEKKIKINSNNERLEKSSKKKSKQLHFVNNKQTASEKGLILSQTDLKYYCEECDTCFQNRELYKLHPCYQK